MLDKSLIIQNKILDYISQEIQTKGYPPTIREIGNEMQIRSSSTIHLHLRNLEKRGLIRRDPMKPRAIELVSNTSVSDYKKTHLIPITRPEKDAWKNSEEVRIELPEYLCGHDDSFVYKVNNSALVSSGIYPGDMLVVQRQQKISDEGFYLVETNGAFFPVRLKQKDGVYTFSDDLRCFQYDQCRISGIVLSMFRKFKSISKEDTNSNE